MLSATHRPADASAKAASFQWGLEHHWCPGEDWITFCAKLLNC